MFSVFFGFFFFFFSSVLRGIAPGGVSRYPSCFALFFFYGGCSGISEPRALPFFTHRQPALLREPVQRPVSDVAQRQHQASTRQHTTGEKYQGAIHPRSLIPHPFSVLSRKKQFGAHCNSGNEQLSRGILSGMAPSGNSIGRFFPSPGGNPQGSFPSPVYFPWQRGQSGKGGRRDHILGRALRLRVSSLFSRN